MHLNGIAKRITALALGAALLTATALPAFAEGTQQINVTYTCSAIDGTTFEKISHPTKGTMSADGIVDYIGDGAVNVITDPSDPRLQRGRPRPELQLVPLLRYGDWMYVGTMLLGYGPTR